MGPYSNCTFTTTDNASFDTADDVPVISDGFNAGGQPLSVTLGFAPAPGTLLTLVRNTGFSPVQGSFSGGDPVDVCAPDGRAIARGLVNYDVADVHRAMGRTTRDLSDAIGPAFERSLVHRDHLVLLP